MVTVKFEKQRFELHPDESVLDGLVRQGAPIPYSCRSGVCQSCLMRAVGGVPPTPAQKGLKDTLVQQNYFLACVCRPTESLEVELPGVTSSDAAISATVRALELLNPEIMRVVLDCHDPIEYRAGQFINLFRNREFGRSYSLASVPDQDAYLDLHVRRVPQGLASGWVHEELRPGHRVEIRGPAGDCFYTNGNPQQGLLLIGTGSGLAPLYGIVRDALRRGHTGPIHLFHGSRDRNGLYLTGELRELAKQFPNFDYVPCLSREEAPRGYAAGRAHEIALQQMPTLKNWRLFLCGHPEMVKAAKKKAFLAGASMKDIYADAFHIGQPTHEPNRSARAVR